MILWYSCSTNQPSCLMHRRCSLEQVDFEKSLTNVHVRKSSMWAFQTGSLWSRQYKDCIICRTNSKRNVSILLGENSKAFCCPHPLSDDSLMLKRSLNCNEQKMFESKFTMFLSISMITVNLRVISYFLLDSPDRSWGCKVNSIVYGLEWRGQFGHCSIVLHLQSRSTLPSSFITHLQSNRIPLSRFVGARWSAPCFYHAVDLVPLDASFTIRFSPDTTVGAMLDAWIVDHWIWMISGNAVLIIVTDLMLLVARGVSPSETGWQRIKPLRADKISSFMLFQWISATAMKKTFSHARNK